MSDLDIIVLDNSNNIIEETSLKKPKTYQELVEIIKNKLKKLPNNFNIFYQSPNNKDIIIHSNKEYNLSVNILFVREIKENKLNQSINYDNLSDSKLDLLDERYSCLLCSELIKHENPLFCYSCQKIFHKKCLKNWDAKRNSINEILNCPNCRKELPLEQWEPKLDFEEKRIKDTEILDKLNHYELKDINENEIGINKEREIIKEYQNYKDKILKIFKDILIKFNEINSLIKQEKILTKINILIKGILSGDSFNLSINDIYYTILDELEIIKNLINININIYKAEKYESGDQYSGEFINDLKDGKGTYYWNDGDKYEGEYKNGKKDGKGIYYYNDGDRYEGDYKNDKREGKGIYFFKKGNKYIGDFKNGLFEGKGIMIYKDGDRYEGDYKNDKKDGKGIYYYNDGDRYEGDFKNGKKEGKCVYYYKNGARYEGDFKDGKKEGKGIYYYKNGDREMGDFLNGKEVGKHVTLHANGEISSKIY